MIDAPDKQVESIFLRHIKRCQRMTDDEGLRATRPQPPKGDPEASVGGPDERASPRRQGGELLAKGEILEQVIAAGTEGRGEHSHRHRYESRHGEEKLPCPIRNVNESRWNEVLAKDNPLRRAATLHRHDKTTFTPASTLDWLWLARTRS